MIIKTSDTKAVKKIFDKLSLPKEDSHKGQNGKLLIIGGSSLFHAASLWAAETASHFVDMVHYSSTLENEKIFFSLKKVFRNGMIVSKSELGLYVKEDDVVLLGPGMVRGKIQSSKLKVQKFTDFEKIKIESDYTHKLTKYLINNFSDKKFVLDAGALQMMDRNWLSVLKVQPILTPHQREFENLFKVKIERMDKEEKVSVVAETARRYHCIILFKAIDDIISDGKETFIVKGGNAGLTKGGTGDVLGALAASFYVKNSAIEAAVLASTLLKKTAETLFESMGSWYNVSDIINRLPSVLHLIRKII